MTDATQPTETSGPDPSPFDRLRARTVIWWSLGWLVVVSLPAAFNRTIPHAGYSIYFALIAWLAYESEHFGFSMKEFLRPIARDEWRRLWLVLPAFMISIGCGLLLVLLIHASPETLRQMSEIDARGSSLADTLYLGLITVVVGPATEELVFRGIILQRWTRKWGFKRAAIFSSAIFAILHLNPIGAFVFAMLMVHLYTRTGSLRICIAAHMINNGFVFLSAVSGKRDTQDAAAQMAQLQAAWPGFLLVAAIGAAALFVYFRRVPPLSAWKLPEVRATPAR
jgi:membrane protease YdiL (CAAX protease family)